MDILERLRIPVETTFDDMPYSTIKYDYEKAIAEIESLRAKLAQPTPSQSVELENILHNYADFVRDQIESAGMVDLDFAIKTVSAEINQLFKPQPTPSQSNDEYLFADWWHDHHIDFNHNDIVKACELAFNAGQAQSKLSKSQPTSQDAVDAERYRCLCSMATKDYERSVGYQFSGKLNDFVDDIKPYVDEALARNKRG